MNSLSLVRQVLKLVTGWAVILSLTVVPVMVGVTRRTRCGLKGPGTTHRELNIGVVLLQVSVIILEVLVCVSLVTVLIVVIPTVLPTLSVLMLSVFWKTKGK